MKKVAGGLRLDLAAFRELEAFAQLGTELDKATQLQLDRGYRMVELLKQPQYQPMNVVDQVMSIYAGTEGFLDDVPVKEVQRWEAEFLALHARAEGRRPRAPRAREEADRPDRGRPQGGADRVQAAVGTARPRPRPAPSPCERARA